MPRIAPLSALLRQQGVDAPHTAATTEASGKLGTQMRAGRKHSALAQLADQAAHGAIADFRRVHKPSVAASEKLSASVWPVRINARKAGPPKDLSPIFSLT
ncbi:MAG: hypothetical protein JSS24_14950 [Proteobacteria bacterium]|nr:hypothetical protein [Pseudomonadota bacterium]